MKRNPYTSVDGGISLSPATVTGTANGSGVDRNQSTQNFRTAALMVVTGTVTDGTHAFKLQESGDDVDFTDVPAAQLLGDNISVTSTESDTVLMQGYTGNARYLRAVVTVTGATSGGTYAALVVLAQPRRNVERP